MLSEYCRETLFRALSSAGRATALQAVGHKFDPYSAHHKTDETEL
jgi:hypothetical protein